MDTVAALSGVAALPQRTLHRQVEKSHVDGWRVGAVLESIRAEQLRSRIDSKGDGLLAMVRVRQSLKSQIESLSKRR